MVKKIKHHWDSSSESGQKQPSATIIGAPDDRGVLNVGGRLGAGHGPSATRQMLSNFMLGIDGEIGKISLSSGFDIDLGENIEAGHQALRDSVSDQLAKDIAPIVIGGGHDYGYPHVAGAFDFLRKSGAEQKLALINVDAHLDVRPPGESGVSSGSPFFLAIEEGVIDPANFVEFGIQEHCNDQMFGKYVEHKGVTVVSLDETRSGRGSAAAFEKTLEAFSKKGFKIVVSFDVDAVQMAHAPGVSAPQSDGFTPGDFLAMARACGENPDVLTIGFFELAPPLDIDSRTTRLVATAIHRFLSGFSRRGSGQKSRMRRLLARR